ncbi:concanavalin A-like lectin/glucanase domain-containing protein [Gilbertella persicaria]|uniref:concanavalin A-like lectin/glucanase domain-containing protein n=1 Tax=Gilbertella persicaria TaxID=101096 RepID=UPI00221EE3D1|nr:concanavalin A-like lectin/glucanase domain-containing protein [Gilbertella persicaria]KAI8076444.1 concanavalin A-like lectin/glucanase domain-containing protein [Gilbertella persicaria]
MGSAKLAPPFLFLMSNQQFDQEPPSYDHAFQTNLDPGQVYQFGKLHDASIDSYERGEMFIQAFSQQIDTFPALEAQHISQHGFLNTIRIDTETQKNQLFQHPKGKAAFRLVRPNLIQFWPTIDSPLTDLDVTAQASHPFLTLSEYQSQYNTAETHHYFEITVENVGHSDVVMAIGLATKPYPIFRMPGWNKFSVGYHSDDGHKFCDDATGGQSYGPSWKIGDTVGCGYCPETGNVFFTLNGQWLGYAFQGLKRHYYFASIGTDGPAQIKVNFGHSPFQYKVDPWAGQFI